MKKTEFKFFSSENYELSENGLYVKKGKEFTYVCRPIWLDKKIRCLETKEIIVVLAYVFEKEIEYFQIPATQLQPKELEKLVGIGVDVNAETKNTITKYLIGMLQEIDTTYTFSRIGWHFWDEKLYYFHSSIIGQNGVDYLYVQNVKESSCDLSYKGSLQEWLAMYETSIKGKSQLETMVSIGATACVIGYLSQICSDIPAENFMVHLVADSSTGKSIVGVLATSLFGKARRANGKGLVKTWNATSNFILKDLVGNFGVPIVLDELSSKTNTNVTTDVYNIAHGADKGRLKANNYGIREDIGNWRTCIISNGEINIFDDTQNLAGLAVRAVVFENIEWFDNAKHADAVNLCCEENYGLGAEKIAMTLASYSEKKIEDRLRYCNQLMIQTLHNDRFSDRLAKKYSIVLFAALTLNDALDLGISVKAIADFLAKEEAKQKKQHDIGRQAYEIIANIIQENIEKFKYDNHSPRDKWWGKIEKNEDMYVVYFLAGILKKELKIHGFVNIQTVLQAWENEGILISEPHRKTQRVKIFSKNEQGVRLESLNGVLPAKKIDTVHVLVIPEDALNL